MATRIERQIIALGELVEELQGELETLETARRSPLHLNLLANLTTAVMEQAQDLHQSVNQITISSGYQNA